MRVKFVALIILLSSSVLFAIEPDELSSRMEFIDEAWKSESFSGFRSHLISAIETRDSVFLVNHIHDYVETWPSKTAFIDMYRKMYSKEVIKSMGEPTIAGAADDLYRSEFRPPEKKSHFVYSLFENRARLQELYGVDKPWDRLARIVSLGGCFVDDSLKVFHAPYTWARWDSSNNYQIAVVKDTAYVYSSNYGMTVVDTLSYDLVFRRGSILVGGTHPRVQIERPNGVIGYMDPADVYGRWSGGIEFKFIDDKWVITKNTTVRD